MQLRSMLAGETSPFTKRELYRPGHRRGGPLLLCAVHPREQESPRRGRLGDQAETRVGPEEALSSWIAPARGRRSGRLFRANQLALEFAGLQSSSARRDRLCIRTRSTCALPPTRASRSNRTGRPCRLPLFASQFRQAMNILSATPSHRRGQRLQRREARPRRIRLVTTARLLGTKST
jgi:hypothetical protein